MPTELLQPDYPVVLTANVAYALPGGSSMVTWQSAAGSDMQASLDGVTYSSIGLTGAGEVRSAFTGAAFIKTSTASTSVSVRKAPVAYITSGSAANGAGLTLLSGSAAAPPINFSASDSSGIFYNGGLGISQSGTQAFGLSNQAVNLTNGFPLGFSGSSPGNSDIFLVRDGAGVLAMRNSTNPQTINVYSTYGSAILNTYGQFGFASGNLRVGVGRAGASALVDMQIGHFDSSSTNYVALVLANTEKFKVTSDGVANVSASVAPPAGGSVTARLLFGNVAGFGIYYGTGLPTVSAALGSIYFRRDGSSTTTRMYVNTDGGTTWTNFITTA